MTDYLDAAAQHLEVKRKAIVDSKQVGNELVVLVDYGIGGIKKYRLSLESLAQPEPEPAVAGEAAKPPEQPDEPLTFAGETVGYPVEMVAEKAEVEHLVDGLRAAGFDWSHEIVEADDDELTAIPGIGKATARKLKEAAAELENED